MADEQIILQEAAAWFVILNDENVSEGERARWRVWLAADAAHARIWQRIEHISQPFARATDAAPAKALRDALAKAQRTRRRDALRLLGFGGLAIGSGLLLRHALPWQGWQHGYAVAHADYRTPLGQQQQITLPDGTSVVLNTATAIDIDYGRTLRRIVLHDGEILVDSAPDTQQPPRALVVDTPSARLMALGTRFTVRNEAATGHLAVFEGAVRITLATGGSLEVPAGRQARFTTDNIEPDGAAEPARESWSRGELVADNISLADFVAELSRYTNVAIAVSPEVAPLRLVGAYPIANPVRDIPIALATLESALPVRVQKTPGGSLLVGAR